MAFQQHEVERFLYREACMADEWRLEEWLDLWADEDVIYWVPCNKDDVDPLRELSLIYDDRSRLELRAGRVNSGLAWTQEPRSRMRRLISNVEVDETGTDELTVFSNFHLTELRVNTNDHVIWAGRSEHHLRPVNDGFKITFKKVLLLNNDQEIPQLSIFL